MAAGTDYRFESVRLETFKNWFNKSIIPENLAKAGFYYLGINDLVRCFECNVEIQQWEDTDIPMYEHKRWSQNCRFVLDIPCGNVPIGVDPKNIPKYIKKSEDVCGIYNESHKFYKPDTPITLAPIFENIITNDKICKICYDNKIKIIFMPCGHLVACQECSDKINNCAICRKPIETRMPVYF